MTFQDISIIIIAVIIASSGVLINLLKKGGGSEIMYEQDGKTLLVFRLVIPSVLIVAVAVYFTQFGHYGQYSPLVYLGYILVATGLLVRWIAVLSLGDAFTVKVTILKNQTLKTGGIYKMIRHPSYTGFLMYYIGLGMVMQNWLCLLLLTVAPILVALKRIKLEEVVLNNHFGDQYRSYSIKTWKLIPFVF